MDLFSPSWAALRTAVADLTDKDFEQPSGCAGWLVRDLVCHLIIDAQDVLITLVTPAATDAAPTADATTYWHVTHEPPAAEDPLASLTVRLAAAYEDMALLTFHLDDVGSAAARAAELADPAARVTTQNQILTVEDYLTAYVLEWTLHHLDLTAHLPTRQGPSPTTPGPSPESLAHSRTALERIAGTAFPGSLTDEDALLIGTGRRAPSDTERAELGLLEGKLPLVLG
ncbi:maleylpyruvate isomerase family protein [Streptomyces phaeolivaceus]|uniref:Maleylpyruvate isomerase family protein n=1 Tax=Streptomyces phaeolivaceus TaxID=2653200 RepID=A0A5P8K194_9ACTN|nr:maleylpyruvate isomerase N-terminal domain-containing protein [Streptomyces phaeolivaceus]QFQ96804.1 maleylpyruvate isomerase family protein [Streptomyces phaeolivaceus]